MLKIKIIILIAFVLSNYAIVKSETEISWASPMYHGYYFWYYEDIINQLDEVKTFTNIVHTRIDTTPTGIRWNQDAAKKIREQGQKMIVQLPIEANEQWLTNTEQRRRFLKQSRKLLYDTGSLPFVAYIELGEEWYTHLIPSGSLDNWVILKGQTRQQKYEIIKKYLEDSISDAKTVFQEIPIIITEGSVKRASDRPHSQNYPVDPPSNLDAISIDAYFVPTNSSCDSDQRELFNKSVKSVYDAAITYGKPLIMVGQAFSSDDFVMLSECQMNWFYQLTKFKEYRIDALLWFIYPNTNQIIGVRSHDHLIDFHKQIGNRILNK